MIPLIRDTEIRRLVKGGSSYRAAAGLVGCSLRTVQRALMPPSARKAVQRVEGKSRRKAAVIPDTPFDARKELEQVARTGVSETARVSAARALLEVERVQDVERERDAAKETARRIARAAARIVQQLAGRSANMALSAVAALEAE